MTTRREVPFAGDALAWVHNELAEIKSRLNLIHQAADQSRGLAVDAADKAHQVQTKLDGFDGHATAIDHIQDDLRAVREQITRAQDDIHSLRQSREELERRELSEAERIRQDKNELSKRFTDFERYINGWHEQVAGVEEHNRRNLDAITQLSLRLESLEAQQKEGDTLQSRTQATVSRIDEEIRRFTGAIAALENRDDSHLERVTSALEEFRRLEGQVEGLRTETNRISRIDDRLELVQAERTRHNEQLNEITTELGKIEGGLRQHAERLALIDIRIANFQDEMRKLKEQILLDREQLSAYLHGFSEMEADMRKRQIGALEKEIRDVRGRTLNFGED